MSRAAGRRISFPVWTVTCGEIPRNKAKPQNVKDTTENRIKGALRIGDRKYQKVSHSILTSRYLSKESLGHMCLSQLQNDIVLGHRWFVCFSSAKYNVVNLACDEETLGVLHYVVPSD